MSYWAATDLVHYLPQAVIGEDVITATSNPINYDEFQVLIDLVSGEFDNAAAQSGYAVPIASSATPAFEYARLVVKHGSFKEVFSSIYVGDDNTLATNYREAYERAIQDLRDGKLTLSGAALDEGESSRLLPRSRGVASPWVTGTWAP